MPQECAHGPFQNSCRRACHRYFTGVFFASPARAQENGTLKGVITWEIELTPEQEEFRRLAEQARAVKNTGQWPFTLQEAVDDIISGLSEEDKKMLRETKREDLIKFHMGWIWNL